MLFSIIIPVYNVENYIGRCLRSIVDQNFSDMEVILIDDGSTDGSVRIIDQIVKEYSKVDIKLLTKENSGASETRNMGISVAKGEYLVFVDSDDVMSENSLAIMAEAAEKNADLCVFSSYINKKGLISETILSKKGSFFIEKEKPIDVLDEYLEKINYAISWHPWSKLFKRDVVVRNGVRFNPDLHSCNDCNFFFKYFMHVQSVYFLNKPVTIYTYGRPGSISTTKLMKQFKSNTFAYSEMFYDFRQADESKHKLLDYASYLYLCVFDLCKDFNKDDIKCVEDVYRKHANVFYYSKRKTSVLRRSLIRFLGFKMAARVYDNLRNIGTNVFKIGRFSRI